MRYTKTEEQYLARYKPSPIHACYNRRYLGVVSGLVPGRSLDEADISSVCTINRAGNRRYKETPIYRALLILAARKRRRMLAALRHGGKGQ